MKKTAFGGLGTAFIRFAGKGGIQCIHNDEGDIIRMWGPALTVNKWGKRPGKEIFRHTDSSLFQKHPRWSFSRVRVNSVIRTTL